MVGQGSAGRLAGEGQLEGRGQPDGGLRSEGGGQQLEAGGQIGGRGRLGAGEVGHAVTSAEGWRVVARAGRRQAGLQLDGAWQT